MTGVRQYWTNLKELVLVAVVVAVAAAAAAVLGGVPHLAWEDCFRLGCRS